jgi:hypothetical protein
MNKLYFDKLIACGNKCRMVTLAADLHLFSHNVILQYQCVHEKIISFNETLQLIFFFFLNLSTIYCENLVFIIIL